MGEIFLGLLESLDLLEGREGNVVSALGQVRCRAIEFYNFPPNVTRMRLLSLHPQTTGTAFSKC